MSSEIVLGFDFGTKQIGVAVGQLITLSARPLTVIRAIKGEPEWQHLATLIVHWQPQALIVGIPFDMYDQLTTSGKAAIKFSQQLKVRYHLPIYQVDEKLSTREAKMRLIAQKKRLDKAKIDAIAAQIIVETWLEQSYPHHA